MEIKKLLDSNIPEDEITTREAWRGGPKLSYLTGAYVINRMNAVIGQGSWGYEIRNLQLVYEGEIEQGMGKVFTTSYISTVTLWADINGKKTIFTEVGYGDGTDKKSKGKAHELATKEAVTDAFKRGAKNLGISMGLGLYFKSGEYVGENSATEPAKRQETTKLSGVQKGSERISTNAVGSATPKTSVTLLRNQIKEYFNVLQSLKKVTKDDFVLSYLKGNKADSLDESQATDVLQMIRTNFPELEGGQA